MKKAICLVGIGLLFVWIVLVGCASVTSGPKTPITTSNVSMLQGNWSGWTTFSSYQTKPLITTLEFINATVPLQGRITVDFGSTRQAYQIASVFPAEARAAGGSLVIINFKNGKISDQGTIIATAGEDFLELTVYSGEKMKMNGWFYYYGTRGTVEFTK